MPEESKADLIAERQANLPLPEDPPVKSDWNSADANINVKAGEGQGEMISDISTGDASSAGLREPATGGSGVREDGGVDMSNIGRQGKDNLNVTEGDSQGNPKNASFNQDIGGKNDPGRLAEQKFQRDNANFSQDAGQPTQEGTIGENTYETLDRDTSA